MYSRKVIDRYVSSIFELVKQDNSLPVIEKDMLSIQKVCQEKRDFCLFVESPVIPNYRKSEILKKIFAKKLHKTTITFLELMAKKGRANALKDISNAFLKRCLEDKNIKIAKVVVATPLDKKAKQDVIKYLEKKTKMKIDLEVEVNPDIIGGLVVCYDDVMLELSIAGQMKKLKHEFISKS